MERTDDLRAALKLARDYVARVAGSRPTQAAGVQRQRETAKALKLIDDVLAVRQAA